MSDKENLQGNDAVSSKSQLLAALDDAERMSDQFSDVKPIPYIIPIERFAGMGVLSPSNAKQSKIDK